MLTRALWARRLWALGLILVAVHLVLFYTDALALQALVALILMVVLPGEATARLLFGNDEGLDVLDRVVLSMGLGYVWFAVGSLGLHYLPGPLTRLHLLAFYDGAILSLWFLALVTRSRWRPAPLQISRRHLLWLGVVLLIAMGLRLPHLGYSEFQGDEGRAMLRAAEVLLGQDGVLFLHKKGPIEILYPTALYGVMGHINEWSARLPFALANLLALLGLFALGRRLVGPRGALVAVGLMAIDGFWIGFSRIVQYQSVVLLMTVATALCAYRVYEGYRSQQPYLLAAAVLAGTGLLAHYEGVFALVPAGYLAGYALWRRSKARWTLALQGATHWLPAIAVGAVLVGAFYLPFTQHPHFSETATYLTEKRVGGGLFYNNVADFFFRASYYNASYYVLTLGGLLVAGVGHTLWRGWRSRGARIGLVALAVAWALAIGFPSLWQVGSINLSVLLFLVTVLLIWRLPLSPERRTVALWLAATGLLYFFLMLKVHTHYYVALPPWSLVVGAAAAGLADRVRRIGRGAWVGLLGVGAALYLICGAYAYIVFIRHDPEYRHNYPQAKPAVYWAPFGAVPPRGGYFGFPYRTAWKAIGGLYARGILQGAYDSNQEDLVTNWYTRGAMRCPNGDYFIVARDVEDPHAVIPGVIDGTYMPAIEIHRQDEPQVWVFQRGYAGEMARYAYEDLANGFDRDLSVPVFRVGAPLDEQFDPPDLVGATFGGHFELVGYGLDARVVPAGEDVMLTLYWRTIDPSPAAHHVFAHLGDRDPVAHADSVPRCGQHPTYRWQAGERVVDRYLLHLADDASEGVYPLRVGMYDYHQGDRLAVRDMTGNDLGSSMLLSHVRVGTPRREPTPGLAAAAVTLGDRARLVGYTVDDEVTAGGRLEVALEWQALQSMAKDYTVFVHLVGDAPEPVAQGDSPPQGGALPTSHWVPGEYVLDVHPVGIPAETPPGSYRVLVGMYTHGTWARLAAIDESGGRLLNDAIDLGTVRIHDR